MLDYDESVFGYLLKCSLHICQQCFDIIKSLHLASMGAAGLCTHQGVGLGHLDWVTSPFVVVPSMILSFRWRWTVLHVLWPCLLDLTCDI